MSVDELGNDGSLDELDALVARCLEREPRERSGALDELCRAHPELAAALRARVSALERVGIAVFDAPHAQIPHSLGEFELLERLGGGGMGVVYRARQRSLGREVALKLIRPEQLYFPKARERFRREAEAIARLAHPAIVPIFQFGEEQGVPYFAMGLIDGPSLARLVDELHGRAPESLRGADVHEALASCGFGGEIDPLAFAGEWQDIALRIARDAALALDHAHRRGVIHRDVKPSNIAVTAEGRVQLFDFGLTLAPGAERMTRTGAHSGTLPYMSPEQLTGEELDGRSDVYSLGVTLYELLTLQLPYAGSDPISTQQRILAGRLDSIRARNRAVRADVETVCSVALSVSRERRYADAAAFARDLDNALAQRPIEARLPGPGARAFHWARTHRALSITAAAALALSIGAPFALWRQSREHAFELSGMLDVERELRARADEQADSARKAETRAKQAEDVARRERDSALAERESSEEMLSFLLDMLAQVNPRVVGAVDVTPLDMLERGAGMIERRLGARPVAAARAHRTLGRIFLDYAQYALAAEQLELALDRIVALEEPAPKELAVRSLSELGDAYMNSGRRAEARRCAEQVLVLAPSNDPLYASERAAALLLAATLAAHEGRLEDTLAHALELEELAPALRGSRQELSALNGLAAFLFRAGEGERAIGVAEQVLRRGSDGTPQGDFDQAVAHLTRGTALMRDRDDEARAAFDCALDYAERSGWADPAMSVVLLANVATLEEQQGRVARAAACFREAHAIASQRLGARHPLYANTLGSLQAAEAASGCWERALELQREILERHLKATGPQSANAARAREELARCLEELGRIEEAIDERRAALQVHEDTGNEGAALEAVAALARLEERLAAAARKQP